MTDSSPESACPQAGDAAEPGSLPPAAGSPAGRDFLAGEAWGHPLPEDAAEPAETGSGNTAGLNCQNHGRPLWDLADLGMFLLFALGTIILVMAAVLGGFTLLNRVLGWGLSADHRGVQTPIAVLVQILWEVLWLGFIYKIVVGRGRKGFWKALQWEQAPVQTGTFLFFGVALSIAIQLLSLLLPKREELPIEQMFDTPASAYLLAFFGICVAPFMEELVFRGFVYPVLERRWGVGLAVLITGGLFAAIHGPQLGGGVAEMSAMLVVGLILSLVRARTGSLKSSFLVHLGYNSTLFILLFISTNRFQTLSP